MAEITFQGNPIHTSGELPAKAAKAPDFKLTTTDLQDKTLADYAGRKKVLNIFPSLDTPVCATSVKKFADHARRNADVAMLQISADLPFAHARFCKQEGLDNVETLSMLRDKSFGEDYGTLLVDGPLAGLAARAVVVLDENDNVLHSQLVPEIADEPDYDAAMSALS